MPTSASLPPNNEDSAYRQLFDEYPVPMWIYDTESLAFLAVNSAAIARYGYSREEFLGMTILDIRPAYLATQLRANLGQWKELNRFRSIHKVKSGDEIEVELMGISIAFAGRPCRIMFSTEVAGLAPEGQTHASCEELFAAFLHSSPVAKIIARADGRLVDVNARFVELLGHSRDTAVGHTLTELGAWVEAQERAQGAHALAARVAWTQEVRLRHRNGQIRTVLLAMQPLPFRGQEGFMASFTDVTEHKVMETRLHRLERSETVGRLSSGIAHDMNNILAPMIMGVPLLRMGLPPAEAEKILNTIEVAAQRGAALVRQLLIFGRGIEGARRPVDPRAVVAEVAAICKQTFPRSIVLSTRSAPDANLVLGDATQLQQVFLNLAVNARDAMPAGGQLEIAIERAEIAGGDELLPDDARPGSYVVIRVSDTGTGIPPELIERIFDPYFTTKDIGRGTGLGLSTVAAIIKSHAGFIRLESKLGSGSTFFVYLPLSPADAVTPPPGQSETTARGRGERILIVDDEETVRSVVRETLLRDNYRVISANDGVEATAVFAATRDVALVVTDLDMPLMDGINLARVLRRMKPAVRVVLATGLQSGAGARRRRPEAKTVGIRHFLAKPFTRDQLLRTIRAALDEAPHVIE